MTRKKLLKAAKDALAYAWEWKPDCISQEEQDEHTEALDRIERTIKEEEKKTWPIN